MFGLPPNMQLSPLMVPQPPVMPPDMGQPFVPGQTLNQVPSPSGAPPPAFIDPLRWLNQGQANGQQAGPLSALTGLPRVGIDSRSPSSFGNSGQMDRNLQAYGRGQADLSAHNLIAAAKLAAGVMGGMGFLGTAANLVRNPSPFTGYIGPTPAGRAVITNGGTVQQAMDADRAHHESATASGGGHESIAGAQANGPAGRGSGQPRGGYA